MTWTETYLSWQPRVLSLLRIMTGLLFLQYGMAKLLKFPAVPAFKDVTLFSLYGLAGTLELVGGALMILGLFTRPVAFILAGEMAFALFSRTCPARFLAHPQWRQSRDPVLLCVLLSVLRRRRPLECRCLTEKMRSATFRQRPNVVGSISMASVAEKVAPQRAERNPEGLSPGLLIPPGAAATSPVST
jgi:putative oxidoreductase